MKLIRSIMVIMCLSALLAQVLQLPLVYLSFYSQQDRIAAEQCVNRFEPVLMCSGQCVLNELVSVALELDEPEGQTPQPSTEDLRAQPMLLPIAAAPLPTLRTMQTSGSANYYYLLPEGRGLLPGLDPPPEDDSPFV